jgi:hypothetical protein
MCTMSNSQPPLSAASARAVMLSAGAAFTSQIDMVEENEYVKCNRQSYVSEQVPKKSIFF